MKYIKLFEKFTKDYMKKIDLKDFKKIKKGSKILYMGGQVEVLDNNGYVLKLKGEDGRTFTINKSQFDHGGMIKEVSDGKKKKKKKEFHPDMMYEAKGKKVINDLYKMDAQIDYLSDADDATKKIWKKAGVNPNDYNQIILYSYVNSWHETKKLLDKSRIKYKELEDPNSAGESFIVFKESVQINEGIEWQAILLKDAMLKYNTKPTGGSVSEYSAVRLWQKAKSSSTTPSRWKWQAPPTSAQSAWLEVQRELRQGKRPA